MPTAYIVDAVRTPGGRRNGLLSHIHPADLGATVVDAIIRRNGVNPAAVDDVIFGCVSQVGAQSGNIGRNVVLSSKVLPIEVPGTSVDRQCGSSLQALHFAAQAVMSGTQDCVIAGGVEVMSMVPIGASVQDGMEAGHGFPKGENMEEKYPGIMFSQFEGAEMVAQKCGITREDMDKAAVASHARADLATREGRFRNEIIPVVGRNAQGEDVTVTQDEGIRPDTTLEKLSKLKTLKSKGGRISAAAASQITDGASCVLICNENGLAKLGLRPRAKIVGLGLAGSDPVMMLYGPVPATQNVLARTHLTIKDIDLYEVNEAFASVPLGWAKDVGADLNKLNVNGGAMALGHPLGATGTKLVATLLNELERTKGRYGLLAICEGGGTANATIIERMPQSRL